jgi:hypothetical protein
VRLSTATNIRGLTAKTRLKQKLPLLLAASLLRGATGSAIVSDKTVG